MEGNTEFQLLKLKVASEIVRSSQAAVAFSRAFYLEEVLIDKIGKELRNLKDEFKSLLRYSTEVLNKLDKNIPSENKIQCEYLRIQSEFDGKQEIFKEFEERIWQAEARRQAKSSLLQKLSTNELMSKFESLTSSELRELQVPEFSCFINESDFGILERLNEDWNSFKKELSSLIKRGSGHLNLVRVNDLSSYNRPFISTTLPAIQRANSSVGSIVSVGTVSDSNVPLDEIGRTFANRSGSVYRRFSSLLRRGKKKGKALSSESFGESSES